MAYNRHLGQGGFRGVDFSSHPSLVSPDRFSNALNVWRDYHSGQGSAIETFPGYRQITKESLGGKIFGIFRYRIADKDYLIIHAGEKLFAKSVDGIDNSTVSEITDAVMATRKSSAFQHGDNFYILDGTHYYKVGPTLTATEATDRYTPITYVNGEEYEQRNALSSHFKEKWLVDDSQLLNHETEGLIFVITDEEKKICSVAGIREKQEHVYIPSITKIGGDTYKVESIGADAFVNDKTIKKLFVYQGVEKIESYAFATTSLVEAYLPWSLKTIESYAFIGSPDG